MRRRPGTATMQAVLTHVRIGGMLDNRQQSLSATAPSGYLADKTAADPMPAAATAASGPAEPGTTTGSSLASTAVARHLRMAAAKVVEWIEVVAACYAAAALYKQLSRLSDAELKRRELSRASLAQDVAKTRRRRGGSLA
jgi:hypothetical protein